jgi:hypothetical protein
LSACDVEGDCCFFTFSETTRLNGPDFVKIEIAPLSVSEKPTCVLPDLNSRLVLTYVDVTVAARKPSENKYEEGGAGHSGLGEGVENAMRVTVPDSAGFHNPLKRKPFNTLLRY